MVIKHAQWLSILVLVISTACVALGAAGPGKTFPTLSVGMKTYTNVTITDISGNSVFFRHSRGFESIQIDSLSPEVQQQLGLQPSTGDRSSRKRTEAATAASTSAPGYTTRSDGTSPQERMKERIEEIKKSLSPAKTALVLGLPLAGLVVMIVGGIWLIIAAFRVSPGWGIGCLVGSFVCGLINLIFICCHWQEAKKPFFCYLAGVCLFVASAMAIPNLVRTQSPDSANSSTPVQARGQ